MRAASAVALLVLLAAARRAEGQGSYLSPFPVASLASRPFSDGGSYIYSYGGIYSSNGPAYASSQLAAGTYIAAGSESSNRRRLQQDQQQQRVAVQASSACTRLGLQCRTVGLCWCPHLCGGCQHPSLTCSGAPCAPCRHALQVLPGSGNLVTEDSASGAAAHASQLDSLGQPVSSSSSSSRLVPTGPSTRRRLLGATSGMPSYGSGAISSGSHGPYGAYRSALSYSVSAAAYSAPAASVAAYSSPEGAPGQEDAYAYLNRRLLSLAAATQRGPRRRPLRQATPSASPAPAAARTAARLQAPGGSPAPAPAPAPRVAGWDSWLWGHGWEPQGAGFGKPAPGPAALPERPWHTASHSTQSKDKGIQHTPSPLPAGTSAPSPNPAPHRHHGPGPRPSPKPAHTPVPEFARETKHQPPPHSSLKPEHHSSPPALVGEKPHSPSLPPNRTVGPPPSGSSSSSIGVGTVGPLRLAGTVQAAATRTAGVAGHRQAGEGDGSLTGGERRLLGDGYIWVCPKGKVRPAVCVSMPPCCAGGHHLLLPLLRPAIATAGCCLRPLCGTARLLQMPSLRTDEYGRVLSCRRCGPGVPTMATAATRRTRHAWVPAGKRPGTCQRAARSCASGLPRHALLSSPPETPACFPPSSHGAWELGIGFFICVGVACRWLTSW